MREVVNALAIAIVLPFVLGMLAAFLFPPLCWWLDRRAARARAALGRTAPARQPPTPKGKQWFN